MITPPIKEHTEMKLRVRSTATKETIRVDASDSSSLLDLKTLIASNLSTPDAPIPPEAVHISLNRSDEIIPSSPGESLRSIGLTSGDLLFYSLRSPFSTATTEKIPNLTPSPVSPLESLTPLSSATPAIFDPTDPTPADGMDVDSEPFLLEAPSLPCFLRRVMETEKGKIQGSMGLTVVAIHAIFLECGFVSCGDSGGGSSLPEGSTSAGCLVSVMYSLPDLIDCANIEEKIKKVSLKFSAVGNHVSIYGCLLGDHPDVYRLCLDSSKLTPLLASATNELSETEQAEVFQLWKIVKDCLSMPLLIDICQKNGLLLPPCFTSLPTDVKIMILELLPSVDLAKAACSSSELRYLASNNELWKGKFLEEFGSLDERNTRGSWKEKFARFWVNRKRARTDRGNALVPYIATPRIIPVPWVPGTQRFPMIGGDYDRFPAIGDLGSLRRAQFPHHPARRNFSTICNLGTQRFPMIGGDYDRFM